MGSSDKKHHSDKKDKDKKKKGLKSGQGKAKAHGLKIELAKKETKGDGKNAYTSYVISVDKKGVAWELHKRYADFFFLWQSLGTDGPYAEMDNPFPPKQDKALSEDAEGVRYDELKKWFGEFMRMPMTPLQQSNTFTFLHLRRHCPPEKGDEHGRKYSGGVVATGYVNKLGGNKLGGSGNWKRRFMVLSDDLLYYQDEQTYLNNGPPKGIIKLNSCYCPAPELGSGNPDNEFSVFALPYELTCRADNVEEMNFWVEIFQNIHTH